MHKTNQVTINEYENYLIKLKINTSKISSDIKTLEDIKSYERYSKSNLEKLESLSIEYKLYDSNYKESMIAMGKFAIGLNKADELKINIKDKKKFIDSFLNFNDKFEDLELKNLMKDAYIWK